jgi:3-hydroxyisobutyrate dehydrogenase-like beta-hydroxyacid dehydrogenase
MKSGQDEVSVVGLGMMSSTLARLLLDQGYRVTVWNRTSAKAALLVRDGAIPRRRVGFQSKNLERKDEHERKH